MEVIFINCGGYKKGRFGEFHYADIYIAETRKEAIEMAKQTTFFKHTGYKGAPSHIDDKYGIDVDDAYDITELLPKKIVDAYGIWIMKADNPVVDKICSGFNLLTKLEKM